VLLTAFLALAYGNTPGLLFVEEPENGLHYSRAKQVLELLRQVSTGEVGNRARQVIVTTRSPIFLNLVRPEEVRIFRRVEGGGVQITPLQDVPNIKVLLDEFAPGELWYLFGEEGLVKGAER
jgi:predicted ATPase